VEMKGLRGGIFSSTLLPQSPGICGEHKVEETSGFMPRIWKQERLPPGDRKSSIHNLKAKGRAR
jgi:hypothetical protein